MTVVLRAKVQVVKMGKKRRLFTIKRSDGVREHRASNTKVYSHCVAIYSNGQGFLRSEWTNSREHAEKNAAHWNAKLGYRAEVLPVRVTHNIRDADYERGQA